MKTMHTKYMVIKTFLCALLVCSIGFNAGAQFKDLVKKADKAAQKVMGDDGGLDVGNGLKEALQFGVKEAVDQLSAEKGYFDSPYKILLPEEAVTVVSKLKTVPGFQDVEANLISKMNEAAEIAAKKATPIFVSAITSLTFNDAMNILMGKDDEATLYLSRTTRTQLYAEFMPVIQSALDAVNARTYWKSAVDVYNTLPFVKKVNPLLDDHVNNKALDGLFSLIAIKEGKIRHDVNERKTDLLKNVFAKQDKK
jgi:tRNA(Glu) U13 pseudouridine synthase TruD